MSLIKVASNFDSFRNIRRPLKTRNCWLLQEMILITRQNEQLCDLDKAREEINNKLREGISILDLTLTISGKWFSISYAIILDLNESDKMLQ